MAVIARKRNNKGGARAFGMKMPAGKRFIFSFYRKIQHQQETPVTI